MEHDLIDRMNALWRTELPDLDPSPLDLVGRVLVIARYLEKSVNIALRPHGINLGQFDILATLRRGGRVGRMTPTELTRNVMLSSGGMTNRLDRLEEAGLVRREPDPSDRRGIVVSLTPQGRKRIDLATATRFEEALQSSPKLKEKDRELMMRWLRSWLLQLTEASSAIEE